LRRITHAPELHCARIHFTDAPGGIITTAAQFQAASAASAAALGLVGAAASRKTIKKPRGAQATGAAHRIRDTLQRISVASAFDSEPEAAQWDPVKAASKLTPQQRE